MPFEYAPVLEYSQTTGAVHVEKQKSSASFDSSAAFFFTYRFSV
jgi:hypothetical protein